MQLRNPKEVTTEEYNEFYKRTFNEYLEPLASSHFTTEVSLISLCMVNNEVFQACILSLVLNNLVTFVY